MRTLESALSEHELITLRVIGEWWELDLTGADKTACVKALAETLSQVNLEQELRFLPAEEAEAMRTLAAAGGRMPVGTFSREHGDVRQMGPGRLEREEPWFAPASPAEALWYRGFLYRGFDEGEDSEQLVEYYFLPRELYAQFPETEAVHESQTTYGVLEPATPPEEHAPAPATAVDDLTTLLAFAQRDGLQEGSREQLTPYLYDAHPDRYDLLLTLGEEADLLRPAGEALKPARPAVAWLEQSREAQLQALVEAWSASDWNDLCHTPGLQCEGSGWSNDPIAARTALLDALPRDENWYRFEDLATTIKERNPDFQRPEGNYDTWYIRDEETGTYLKGFESWDLVEGRLLRFLIEGPLAWLGMAEASHERFRLTERAVAWLKDQPPAGPDVRVPLVVQPEGSILVPHNGDRYQRFQVARVAEPRPLEPGQPYRYDLTPRSLARAKEEGIGPERVLSFLSDASGRPMPASVRRAVERWAEHGIEGRLQPAIILRVRDAEILDTLQNNAKTRSFIGERLGPLAAMLRSPDWEAFRRATAQLGLLLEVEHGSD